jgi:hypothetical protein
MGKRRTIAEVAPEVIEAERAKITDDDLQRLTGSLAEIEAHIHAVASATPLSEHPFPHALIAPVLPDWLYEMLRRAWPSAAFFGQPKPSRRIMDLGEGHGSFAQLPDTLGRFWLTLQSEVLQRMLGQAMVRQYARFFDDKFKRLLPRYAKGDWRTLGLEFERAGLMIHSPGFELKPHIDSPRYAVVYLLYCPPDDVHAEEGTDLYDMPPASGSAAARPSLRTLYPDAPPDLAPTVSLPYRRNSLATFLVAERSLHGVTIKRLDDRRVINCAVKLPDAVVQEQLAARGDEPAT